MLPTNATPATALALPLDTPTLVRFCEMPDDLSLFLEVAGPFPSGTRLHLVVDLRTDAEDVDFFAGALDTNQLVEPTAECAGFDDEDCQGTLPMTADSVFIEMNNQGSDTAEEFVLTLNTF